MTRPMVIARRRPMTVPNLPPVIINVAITSVYRVIAVWMPVIVVPRSAATVAMDTFITELSRVIRNWLLARTASTRPAPAFTAVAGAGGLVTQLILAESLISTPHPEGVILARAYPRNAKG